MKIAVIISDASGMAQAGLDVERCVKVFDMPPEMQAHIERATNPYISVSFAMVDERPTDLTQNALAEGAEPLLAKLPSSAGLAGETGGSDDEI